MAEYVTDGKTDMRSDASVDKNGIPLNAPGCNNDEAGLNNHLTGMGWFGLRDRHGQRRAAEHGVRGGELLGRCEGRDMIWNPSDSLVSGLGSPILGGQHNIYVFGNRWRGGADPTFMPPYDEGKFLHARLTVGTNAVSHGRSGRATGWVPRC